MKLNEIKKGLYKEKPVAKLQQDSAGYLSYTCTLSNSYECLFEIPHKESSDFKEEMESQLLIRWLKV